MPRSRMLEPMLQIAETRGYLKAIEELATATQSVQSEGASTVITIDTRLFDQWSRFMSDDSEPDSDAEGEEPSI